MVQSKYNVAEVDRVFDLQRQAKNLQALKNSTRKERIEKIKRIEKWILDPKNISRIQDALWHDLRKSPEETKTTEIVPVLSSIQYIYKNLRKWMKDHAVSAPLPMVGISSRIKYEPKGQVLLIGPWNYPFQLALNPLVHAIAAGNAIVLKPSEIAAATSAILKAMMMELFPENEIAVIEGDIPVATALLEKPFHHIFFTGSPNVGKIVMAAAAKNLTSVTLELGGKSPVVIDESAKLKTAAEKIAWGKCMNNGQTCIAPDYVFVPEGKEQAFADYYQESVNKFYNPDQKGIQASPDYTRIINGRNYSRVKALVDDAVSKGAQLVVGGEFDEQDKFIAPCVLLNVDENMAVMQEEIFGPVLPVLTYKNLESVVERIEKLPKPLAMYILSKNKKNTEYLIQHSTAGGTAVNELMISTLNPALPFGGVNNSGIGKSNGKYSFIEFSNERGVLKRNFLDFKMIFPPYNKKVIDLLMRLARL